MITLFNVLDAPGVSVPLLWRLMQERPAYANISHQSMPTMEGHKEFVLHHPYHAWYLIEVLSKEPGIDFPLRVGAIYLTKQNEIGIFILQQYQGMGYATAAIEELKRRHPKPYYLANVAPGNGPGIALFERLGGKIIQQTFKIFT